MSLCLEGELCTTVDRETKNSMLCVQKLWYKRVTLPYTVWNWDSARDRKEQWILQINGTDAKYGQSQEGVVSLSTNSLMSKIGN